ncbi:restriction endonuclease [Aromatoleum toluclasticum]|uniref:restriction endonuclease n=1 Tax=Aromatoleum toluclasticum TaxID=92003 RepID=UPI001E5C3E6C|nr:restriction endonuclease [Aromatoleum toluclasticum]
MSWREFEGLVAETFRQKGYRVVERGGDGPDGGVDLEAYQGRDKYLIQCKQWKARQVGVATVRELYGVMTAERAVGGFVAASGSFTADAQAFAEGRSIRLVDARGLRRMIGGVKVSAHAQAPAPRPDAAPPANPACPKCGSTMVRRTAKSGSNAGSEFWGCAKYPACRGIRN